jgi:hypothetical protein
VIKAIFWVFLAFSLLAGAALPASIMAVRRSAPQQRQLPSVSM